MVSEEKIFFHYILELMTPLGLKSIGMASLDPRGLIGRIYVGDHKTLLYTKYISSGPHGFREEDFLSFPKISLWEIMTPGMWPI